LHRLHIPDITGTNLDPEMSELFGCLCSVANHGAHFPAAIGEHRTGTCADETGSSGYDDGPGAIDCLRVGLLRNRHERVVG
jgi:hypothetical protein